MKKPIIKNELREFVIKTAQRAAWEMGVSDYQLDIEWVHEPEKREHSHDDKYGHGETFAKCVVDRRYLRAIIKIYPGFIKEFDEGSKPRCAEIIAHEVAHIVTEHMYILATCSYKDSGETEDARERLTERIGRMALRLADPDRKNYDTK